MISQQVTRLKQLSSVTHKGSLVQLRESVGHRSSSCTVYRRYSAEGRIDHQNVLHSDSHICVSFSLLPLCSHPWSVGPTSNKISFWRLDYRDLSV